MKSLIVLVFSLFTIIVKSQTVPIPFRFTKVDLPLTAIGPEASTFDPSGGGPYTGISDGRIVKFDGSTFVDQYITAPNRSKLLCDGSIQILRATGVICGRPFGLEFYKAENELYIADAFQDLVVVKGQDKLATPVQSDGAAKPFKFLDGLVVDQEKGDVYFTDASGRFDLSGLLIAVAVNDSTGRLIKYERSTKKMTVLLSNLGGPAGVALSPNRDYVLVTEFISKRVKKLWLSGPKAFQSETIITFQGNPDNIKLSPDGNFWVAVTEQNLLLISVPKAVKMNENGTVLLTYDLSRDYPATSISEFHQRGNTYYVGSLVAPYMGIYNE